MTSILQQLQVYGVSKMNENAFLSSILLGEPSILIGPPGTAKTELAKMIGKALREYSRSKSDVPSKHFSYHIYDASKINFENLIGFPDPGAYQKGEINYIKSPETIWDKDLVVFDELNRCVSERQSNFFEILRSRTCNGIPTNNKYIFSTINPFGDQGTQEMSDALVDRHLYYLHFGDFSSISEVDQLNIIQRVGDVDAYALRNFLPEDHFSLDVREDKINQNLADIGENIYKILEEASKIYVELSSDLSDMMPSLLRALLERMRTHFSKDTFASEVNISGRRAGMAYRGILAYRAIEQAKGIVLGHQTESLPTSISAAFKLSIPLGIASNKIKPDEITKVHTFIDDQISKLCLTYDSSNSTDVVYTIYNSLDPLERLHLLLTSDLDIITKKDAWGRLASTSTTIETLLGAIKSINPQLVPQHLDLREYEYTSMNITIPPAFVAYTETIEAVQKKYKDNILMEYALYTALDHYFNSVTDKFTAFNLISSLEDRLDKINEIISSDIDTVIT